MTDIDENKCSELINENADLEEGEIVSDDEGLIDEEPPNKLNVATINSDVLMETDVEFSAPKLVHEIEKSPDNAYSSLEDEWQIEPKANEHFEPHVSSTSYSSDLSIITHHTNDKNSRFRKTNKVKRYSPTNCDFRKSRHHSNSDPSDSEIQTKSHLRQTQMLCKFHVLGCCSRKNQCHFMHSDFPCKHYYLGLKGHDESSCKLSHGKPLNSQLRSILLRHLKTASPDLLGDFPRFTDEKLIRKMDRQHKKLQLKYISLNSPHSSNSLFENETVAAVDISDSIKIFSEVLRGEQIAILMLNGIDNIAKFRQLTIGQFTKFNISVEQVQKILQKALANVDHTNKVSHQSGTVVSCLDVDMRLAALRNPTNPYFIPKTVVPNENFKFDIENTANQPDSEDESAELQIDESWQSPSRKATFSHYNNRPDYGQYELEVTESWDDISDQNTTCSGYQNTDEEHEPLIVDSLNGETPFSVILNEPTSDDSLFQTPDKSCISRYNETGDIGGFKAAEETNAACDHLSIESIEDTYTTLNITMDYDNIAAITTESKPHSLTIDEVHSSSDILQTADESLNTTINSESSERSFQTAEITTEPVIRIPSIENTFHPACRTIDYTDSLNLVIEDIELRTSKLPQPLDKNLNLPFKRVQLLNANEIYASIKSHELIPYKVVEFDIPKSNYDSVRRNGIPLEDIKDPRLRRIFSAGKLAAPDIASEATMHTKLIDPRLKRVPDSLADITKKINQTIQTALVMSDWYNTLPQDQQVLANIQLDSLKLKLNQFHSYQTSAKKFDLSFVRKNILLQQVITNLGLNIDDGGLIQQKVCWDGDHTTYVFPSATRVMTLNNNYPAGSD